MARLPVLLLILMVAFAAPLQAQELEETLSEVGSAYAAAYVRPFVDALGANLNTGLYHDAAVGPLPGGIHVYVGVEGFGALLDPDEQTFDLSFGSQVDLDRRIGGDIYTVSAPATFEVSGAPTMFGEEDPAVATVTARFDTTISRFGIAIPVSFDTTFTREIVGGILQTDIVPTAVPHVRLGTLYGTDFMVRWLPNTTITDVGTIGLLGLGVRHSISQYLPAFPLHVAVQAAWQELTVDSEDEDEILGASTFAASVAVSRRIGVLTLFGGLQMERSTLDVAYDLQPDPEVDPVPVSFELTGAANARGTVGLGLSLGPLALHGSYSKSQVDVVRVGLGISY